MVSAPDEKRFSDHQNFFPKAMAVRVRMNLYAQGGFPVRRNRDKALRSASARRYMSARDGGLP